MLTTAHTHTHTHYQKCGWVGFIACPQRKPALDLESGGVVDNVSSNSEQCLYMSFSTRVRELLSSVLQSFWPSSMYHRFPLTVATLLGGLGVLVEKQILQTTQSNDNA